MSQSSRQDAGSWDPHDPGLYPFEVGKRYRIARDFKKGAIEFQKNLILVFKTASYGPYDDAIIYEFETLDSKQRFTWWLFQGESIGAWSELFEQVASGEPA